LTVGYYPAVGVYSRLVGQEQNGPEGERDAAQDRAVGAPAGIGDVVTNVGSRIQEILDTAERVASEIRAEAEASSSDYLNERRREADRVVEDRVREFGTMVQSLSLRIESLQREAGALVDALEEARRSLGGLEPSQVSAASTQVPPAPPAPQYPPPPAPDHSPLPADDDAGAGIPERAILRATQMAVAGTERTEIERMLRTEFDVKDPVAVVDEMLRSEPA
jgi:hypothetical protein